MVVAVLCGVNIHRTHDLLKSGLCLFLTNRIPTKIKPKTKRYAFYQGLHGWILNSSQEVLFIRIFWNRPSAVREASYFVKTFFYSA